MTCITRPRNQITKDNECTVICQTNLFELVLPILQIQMFPDSRILTSESDNLLPIEIIKQPRIDLSRELKEEWRWTSIRWGINANHTHTHLIEELI